MLNKNVRWRRLDSFEKPLKFCFFKFKYDSFINESKNRHVNSLYSLRHTRLKHELSAAFHPRLFGKLHSANSGLHSFAPYPCCLWSALILFPAGVPPTVTKQSSPASLIITCPIQFHLLRPSSHTEYRQLYSPLKGKCCCSCTHWYCIAKEQRVIESKLSCT